MSDPNYALIAALLTCYLRIAVSYSIEDFRDVIEALGNGLIDVKEMITRKTTLDRVVEDGILALMHEKDKHMKILVDVRA